MAIFKDIFDIPKDIYDRFVERRKTQKLQISDYLFVISDSLEKVDIKLLDKQLPKEEGNFLNIIVTHANKFALPLQKKYPELAQVFNIQLPEILSAIQIADYFIDGQLRPNALLTSDKKYVILKMTQDSAIKEASENIKKAKGIISAHATKFKIEGK